MAVLQNGRNEGGQVGQLAQVPHCLKGPHKTFTIKG